MKYYIITGEASGDLHGSNLVKEIKKLDNEATVRCWGGDRMQEQGAQVVKHIRDLAIMGFVEVLKNLRTIFRNIDFCKKDIAEYKPDVIIFVDYPGFNLRIAKFAKQNGFKTVYYISPQLWAWKESRVKIIRKYIDRMIVIFPFEKAFYAKHNITAHYVGHPLLDELQNFGSFDQNSWMKEHNLPEKPIIALLPGSRKQEIVKMLPIFLQVVPHFNDFQFIIAGAPSIDLSLYLDLMAQNSVKVIFDQTYNILQASQAALVTSGTATLETALFKTPEVVCYKTGKFTFAIAKRIVNVKFISIVNLIMDRLIVTELLQEELNAKNLVSKINELIFNPEIRKKTMEDMIELRNKLGNKGASEKAALLISEIVK